VCVCVRVLCACNVFQPAVTAVTVTAAPLSLSRECGGGTSTTATHQ